MSKFLLPKFGPVHSSFLGFTEDGAGTYTVLTGASAGPTYRGIAGTQIWVYEPDENSDPFSGTVGTQMNVVDPP